MKTVLLALCLFFSGIALAQMQVQPPENPADYSGMYSFLAEGEFVQISIDPDRRLTGFVSRYGNLPSDRGLIVEQSFNIASLKNERFEFTTERVHGVWYEFRGSMGRGEAKSAATRGYYVLRGTLLEHISDADKKVTTRSRQIEMKSFPQDVGLASKKE